jgi:hypothetical protein
MSFNLSRSEEEQENLATIEHRYANLKDGQDKLYNLSRRCPRLTKQERYRERRYTYYTLEEITYLDYMYCVNKTRLPVLCSLHSFCTLYRVSFFQEVQIINDHSWYSNTNYLMARPRDSFQFTFAFSRSTFPIDYLVYHNREIPEIVLRRKNYITVRYRLSTHYFWYAYRISTHIIDVFKKC